MNKIPIVLFVLSLIAVNPAIASSPDDFKSFEKFIGPVVKTKECRLKSLTKYREEATEEKSPAISRGYIKGVYQGGTLRFLLCAYRCQ